MSACAEHGVVACARTEYARMQTVSASPGERNPLADSARVDIISVQIMSPDAIRDNTVIRM